MNLELFPAAQNNGAAGGAAAAGAVMEVWVQTRKKVLGQLGGNCGAVGHQSEVARRRQVPVLNQCQAAAGAGSAPGRDRCGALHYYSSTCAK